MMIPYHARNRLRKPKEGSQPATQGCSRGRAQTSRGGYERCPRTGFPVLMIQEMQKMYAERQKELLLEKEKDNTYWYCIVPECTRTRKNDDEWADDDAQHKLVQDLTEAGHKKVHFSPYCATHTVMMINGQL